MKIDIQPKLRLATDIEKICMELREINALYVFITKDGVEESVKFDEKSLDEFCRNRSVSEMINIWKEGFKSEVEKYRNAVKTNIHPIWDCTIKVMHPITKTWTGEYLHNQPLQMTREQKRYFKSEADRIENTKVGEIDFVKIVLRMKNNSETNLQGFTLSEFTKSINEEMERAGLPMSKTKKQYHYTYWTKEEVLAKWFNGYKTPKEIVEGIEKRFQGAWS